MWHPENMRFTAAAGVALVVSGGWASAQINDQVNAGSVPYSMNPSFFTLPEGRPIGSTAGLALDPDGSSIWTYDRCGDNWCVGCADSTDSGGGLDLLATIS